MNECLDNLVVNGVFNVQWQRPTTTYDNPPPKSTASELPSTHPLMQYKRGQITEAQACKLLDTDERGIFRMLIENRILI